MSGTKANTDPIFAKIEAHRAAVRALVPVSDIRAAMDESDPAIEDTDRKLSKANDREKRSLRALLRCRPTTLAGMIAFLDHLGQPQLLREKSDGTVLSGTDCWWEEDKDEVRAFPHMLAGALRDLIGEVRP
jgi:hypothetical protein